MFPSDKTQYYLKKILHVGKCVVGGEYLGLSGVCGVKRTCISDAWILGCTSMVTFSVCPFVHLSVFGLWPIWPFVENSQFFGSG